MTDTKMLIVVEEPDGGRTEYSTSTKKNAHDVARTIGKEGFFATGEKAGGFVYYPPSRIVLVTTNV
jgi:hypothetical protein